MYNYFFGILKNEKKHLLYSIVMKWEENNGINTVSIPKESEWIKLLIETVHFVDCLWIFSSFFNICWSDNWKENKRMWIIEFLHSYYLSIHKYLMMQFMSFHIFFSFQLHPTFFPSSLIFSVTVWRGTLVKVAVRNKAEIFVSCKFLSISNLKNHFIYFCIEENNTMGRMKYPCIRKRNECKGITLSVIVDFLPW